MMMTSRYRECLPWLDMQDTLHTQDTVRMQAMLATHMLPMQNIRMLVTLDTRTLAMPAILPMATHMLAMLATQLMAMVDTQLLAIPGLAMLACLLDIMDCWLCLLHQPPRRTIEIQG